MYERNDRLVDEAAKIAFKAELKYAGEDEKAYGQEMKRASETLDEAERLIKVRLRSLRYASVLILAV